MNNKEKWIREYLKLNGLRDKPDSREGAVRAYNEVFNKTR